MHFQAFHPWNICAAAAHLSEPHWQSDKVDYTQGSWMSFSVLEHVIRGKWPNLVIPLLRMSPSDFFGILFQWDGILL